MDLIRFTLITESNCLIGNQTTPFSTGGVDQSTLVDNSGYPMISGSAFKGAVRNIYRENRDKFNATKKYMEEVFNEILSKYDALISEYENDCNPNQDKIDQLNNIIVKIKRKQAGDIPEYIFGIEELNNTPKFYFNDIKVKDKRNNIRDYFIVDMKNTIEEKENKLESKPRIYKCIRPGVEVEGVIRFNESGFSSNELRQQKTQILEDLKKALLLFNDGFYGIGNSKSRGYGNIKITIKTGDSHDI